MGTASLPGAFAEAVADTWARFTGFILAGQSLDPVLRMSTTTSLLGTLGGSGNPSTGSLARSHPACHSPRAPSGEEHARE